LLEHRFDETMPIVMKDIMSGRRLTQLSLVIGYEVVIYVTACWATDVSIANSQLSLGVKTQDGSYSITASGGSRPVIRSIVGAQLDHHWAKSSDYPKHEISQGEFQDVLGHGRQITVVSTGLVQSPNLIYIVRLAASNRIGLRKHSDDIVSLKEQLLSMKK
jgi:hypothetical protein